MVKKFEDEIKEVVGEKVYEEIKEQLEGIEGNAKKIIIKKHRKHDDEECGVHKHKHHKHHKHHEGFRKPNKTQKTKLFTSKEEMVEFVNLKGEEGHQIDIFKIEEGLYKVVVIERRH